MRKKGILAIAIILFVLSVAYATSGTYNLRYIVYRYVEKNVFLFFTDTEGNNISTKALDLSLGLGVDDAQACLVCSTNENSRYYINLSFAPMHRVDTVANVVNRDDFYYKAQVWSADSNPVSLGTVDISSEQNRSVKFVGATVTDISNMEDFFYPISFSFTDFMDDYEEGSFVATITAEVTAQ